jgi:hypothetical protein
VTENSVLTETSCAVEVFLATALLHREQPGRPEFTIQEIINRAGRENITGELRSGVSVHTSQHCVANKAPNPGKHRMLFATGKHTRRLLLPGDEMHPGRTGKIFPDAGEIPERYLELLSWAKKRYEEGGSVAGGGRAGSDQRPAKASSAPAKTGDQWLGSLLELEGLGKEYWKDVDPDEFVRKLREGWE